MATDPPKSLAPKSMPAAANNGLSPVSESDLADFSLRELLGMLLSSVGLAERKAYLERLFQDKPNGFYDRSLQLGTILLDVRVPRTRSGDFRPASLPPLYQRGYSDETPTLLLSLLSSGRSLNAVKDALHKMGLSSSQQELEAVASGLIEELDLRNNRSLDPDLLVLFLDGKYVEFRDGDRLRPACIYVVVGLCRDGKKQVLTCLPRAGRENLEDWKFVLRSLLERGLRRVLLLVQDDFSGLLPITQSLFPNTDIQLCTVHMQRNAKTHLSKTDAPEFQRRWRAIKSSWNLEVANQQFEQLCDRFAKTSPAFVAELRKKRSILSHGSVTCCGSPEVSPTAFCAQPPDLPPVLLVDMDFAISCSLVPHRRPLHPVLVHRLALLIRVSFRPRLATTPLRFSDSHLHQVE